MVVLSSVGNTVGSLVFGSGVGIEVGIGVGFDDCVAVGPNVGLADDGMAVVGGKLGAELDPRDGKIDGL